ncbi:MAG: VWA domain-containing protein [Vicinamibacteria bacterium]
MREPVDDAALTAYALGELDAGAIAAVEALLVTDAYARGLVEGTRETGAALREALAGTPRLALTDAQRTAVEAAAAKPAPRTLLGYGRTFWLSSAAAAGIAATLVLALRTDREPLPPAPSDLAGGLVYAPPSTVPAAPEALSSKVLAKERIADLRSLGYMGSPEGGVLGDLDERQRYRYTLHADRSVTAAYVDDRSGESYSHVDDNPFLRVADDPRSTFGADVDTASYAIVRSYLDRGQQPPKDAVRLEELVNYFRYDYAGPTDGRPFAVHLDAAGCPWAPTHRLVRIALKGREVPPAERPPSNLVFLIDVSGSMDEPNKLPLVKQSLRMLVRALDERDRVAIVVYAGSEGLALPPTSGAQKAAILAAVDALGAGGSTHASAGIGLAYDVAARGFVRGGTNRVILATDGDFNVGVTSEGDLVRLIQEKAKTGVFLTALGFGTGNLKDATLEKLAGHGNGNYAYVDGPAEARKVLVEEIGGTLVTIAKDVKLQVEFDPRRVGAFRLLGYENRVMAHHEFKDDARDSGDLGAGHTVTALYEIVPAGVPLPGTPTDALKYQRTLPGAGDGSFLTVKLRYKEPEGARSTEMEVPLADHGTSFADAGEDFRFAASVAAFGMVLRDSPHKGGADLGRVLEWTRAATGDDPDGRRAEFARMVAQAWAARAR